MIEESAVAGGRHGRDRRAHQARLTPLDAAFMALESPQAPLHLGCAAVFTPHAEGPAPTFEAIRSHIEARLGRAPRYRQRLVEVPFGLGEPLWVDDERFDITRHVRRASSTDLGELVDEVMSVPLVPDRPLWELWIAERLDDGCVGVVGKVHHCLVDGLAAFELMALLLDATPEPEDFAPGAWEPAGEPGVAELWGAALCHWVGRMLAAAGRMLGWARNPCWPPGLARRAASCARVLAHTVLPLAPRSRLNGPMSVKRHLAWSSRPFEDLKVIQRHFGTTVNDVLLAASAGAVRDLLLAHGEDAKRLKAMVPVSVRAPEERWGNRIAALFPGLPCEQPDAARRLSEVHLAMRERKRACEPETADALVKALGRAPRLVRNLASRAMASPRQYNLTISNIPGPPVPLYLMGCKFEQAYPVVPLAAGHRISIGMTTVNGRACFGVYAEAGRAADADRLARALGEGIDELLARCEGEAGTFFAAARGRIAADQPPSPGRPGAPVHRAMRSASPSSAPRQQVLAGHDRSDAEGVDKQAGLPRPRSSAA